MEVLGFIKERRTIRKYKPDMPPEEVIQSMLRAIEDVLKAFPIPFKLYMIMEKAREEAARVMRLNYSIVKDLAILGKVAPEEFKEYLNNLMKEFLKDLGGAPITLIGLTKLDSWDKDEWDEEALYNWKVAWMIAEVIMLEAKKNGLDTGSFTFSNITVEKEMKEFLGEKDLNIAFALNLGYADENPIPKEIDESKFTIV